MGAPPKVLVGKEPSNCSRPMGNNRREIKGIPLFIMKTRSQRFASEKLKIRRPILLAKLPYDKREARKNMNLAYYIAQSRNTKDWNYILGQKKKLGTPDGTT